MHWRVKQNAKNAYAAQVHVLLATRQLPPVPDAPIARAAVTATLTLGAWMDDDNAVARCKWPIDLLVRLGYLADDRRTCLRWGAFPEQIGRAHV